MRWNDGWASGLQRALRVNLAVNMLILSPANLTYDLPTLKRLHDLVAALNTPK